MQEAVFIFFSLRTGPRPGVFSWGKFLFYECMFDGMSERVIGTLIQKTNFITRLETARQTSLSSLIALYAGLH
jgi:hypothetical protein